MTKPQPIPANQLPAEGLVREKQIVGYVDKKTGQKISGALPISRSAWWKGVKDGTYPQPDKKLGPRCTCWNVETIRALIPKKAS